MKRLILPGWYGSGPDHWQRIWAAGDPEAIVVEQDVWDFPDRDAWVARLHEAVTANPGALLVGHSLGVILVPHYVARHPDAPIAGALLVAPGDADVHGPTTPALASWAPVPRARLPFPSIMVVSHDDPNMEYDRAVALATDLGSEIVDLGNAGHVNVASGFGDWPRGRELADRLERSIAGQRKASSIHDEDLAGIRAWFEQLGRNVNGLDFAKGREQITDDFISFSTFEDIVEGKDEAEFKQWRNVWPKTTGFKARLDGVRAFVSPDRLMAVGIAVWDSTGYDETGKPFPRTGRATITFTRDRVGDPWLSNHGHMSLMRGTPSVSYGPEGKPAA